MAKSNKKKLTTNEALEQLLGKRAAKRIRAGSKAGCGRRRKSKEAAEELHRGLSSTGRLQQPKCCQSRALARGVIPARVWARRSADSRSRTEPDLSGRTHLPRLRLSPRWP